MGTASSTDADEGQLRARILVTRALTTQALHGDAAAREMLAESRDLARAARSAYALALADVQESGLRLAVGDYREVLRLLRDVRMRNLRQPRERYVVLLHRGIAHANLVELAAARSDLSGALALAMELDDPVLEWKARHDLGVAAHLSGDLPTAIRLMREAADLPYGLYQARFGSDLALALLDAGLVDAAVVELDKALTSAHTERQALLEGELRIARARAMNLLDDPAAARRDALRAARSFRARDDERRARHAELIAASATSAGGRSSTDRAPVEPAEGGESVDPWISRFAARVRVQAHLDRGHVDEARAILAGLRRPRSETIGATLHDHLLWAQVWVAEERTGDARRVLRAAARHLTVEQTRSQSLEIRAAVAVHGRKLAALDLDLALRSGAPAQVFAAAERWRAASSRVALGAAADPTTQALLDELRVARHASMSGATTPGQAAEALGRAVELEARVSRYLWTTANAARHALEPVASWTATRSALADRAATLVLFVVSGGRYHRLVIGGGRPRLTAGATVEEVDQLVRRLSHDIDGLAHAAAVPAMQPVLQRAAESSQSKLDAALLDGVPRGTEPVVISPTRALGVVPWSMLPSMHGRPVTVVGSVTRWLRTPRSTTGSPAVAALAGPALPQAPGEVRAVAQAWSGRVSGRPPEVHAAARAADLVAAVGHATIVHVAAHGTHEEQSPLFSSVRLTDGPVVVHSLPRPPTAEHVVLSACEVGRSRVRPGDEALGLTAGLLGIGVGSVVASVAPVTDEAASAAMVAYHHELARGIPASEALARAVETVPAAAAFGLYGADWGLR